jgi:hypothetical protein
MLADAWGDLARQAIRLVAAGRRRPEVVPAEPALAAERA